MTIVRGGPRELVALAWYQLGYRPRESVVVIGLDGVRGRTGLVVRADLGAADRRTLTAVCRSVVRPLRRTGAHAAVVIAVTDRDHEVSRRVARVAAGVMSAAGLTLAEALYVGRAPSARCAARSTAAVELPLAEVESSEVAARMVAMGRVLAPDEATLLADVEPAVALRFRATGEPGEQEVPAAPTGSGASAAPAGSGAPTEQARPAEPLGDPRLDASGWLAHWREVLGGTAVAPRSGFAAALRDVRLRDAVLLTLVPGAGRVPEDLLTGHPVPGSVLDGAPDQELLTRGTALLAAAAREAGPGRRADVLGVLAWAAWWSGDGARARLLAERAVAEEPGHRLARLVGLLLEEAVPPRWVDQGGVSDDETNCSDWLG